MADRRGDGESAAPGLRVVPDSSLSRLSAGVWVGGSPMRMFRVKPAGDELIQALVGDGVAEVNGPTARRLLERLVDAGAAHPAPEVALFHSPDDVTAVVVVRDNADGVRLLSPLVDSVRRVVVVDDGSLDAEDHRSAAKEIGAEYLRLGVSAGPAGARNAGLEMVQTDLVAFVDSDVQVRDDWLDPLIPHFDDPMVAAVAPRVASLELEGSLGAYEAESSPLDMGTQPAHVRPGSMVSHVPSAAIVMRRQTVEELGGFDSDLRFGEDVDLLWRLVADDAVVRYEPRSEVSHQPRDTWLEWAQQRVGYGSSAAPLAKRHGDSVAPVVLTPWSLGVWVAVLSGNPIRALLTALSSALFFARKSEDLPPARSVRLVMVGHLAAGQQLAKACTREWWPIMAVGSLVSKRMRRIWAAALLARVATDHRALDKRAVGLVDDMAYGLGVWKGAVEQRSLRALLPRVRRY